MSQLKVAHVVHDLSVGGVEEAVRNYFDFPHAEVDLQVVTIDCGSNKKSINDAVAVLSQHVGSVNNPISYFSSLRDILKYKPDVLVCSLWRSMIIGLFFKLFCKGKVVCFLHNEKYKNVVDKVLHSVALILFDAIFVDSKKTMTTLVPEKFIGKCRVISFKTKSIVSQPGALSYRFIFWGRLVPQKRIDRALSFFAEVKLLMPNAELLLIGPEEGESSYSDYAKKLGLGREVELVGEKTFPEILDLAKGCSFYLQLSDFEGMAMSVVEAMEMGLVPVVTPVGEISSYVKNRMNGFIVDFDNKKSWHTVLSYIKELEHAEYLRMSNEAIKFWSDKPVYADSMDESLSYVANIHS